jgi:branched-chain amino acid transport system ATP-binding protein
VCARYFKKDVLHGVTLAVGRGEIVALLGGNGSGKSTVLKTISGLLPPYTGSIWLGGSDITKADVHSRQQAGISHLLQGGRIFPALTVEENLDVALQHRRRPCQHPFKLGTYFSQLTGFRRTRAGLLSGGVRQMLALEMILCQEPKYALLDEPSAGIASSIVRELFAAIQLMAKSTGMGILLVEQNIEEAKRIADYIIRLEHGAIIGIEQLHLHKGVKQ